MKAKTVGAEWSRTVNEGEYNSTKVTASIYFSVDEEEDPGGCLEMAIIMARDAVESNVPKKHRRVNIKTSKYLAGIEIEE